MQTESFETIVIGSGAAGLFTAVAAADLGLRVLVLEKAAKLGGGTAISSGLLWVGANHFAAKDTKDDVLAYLRFVGADAVDEARLAAFVDCAPEALSKFEALGIPFRLTARIDHYHGIAPGAVPSGRIVESVPIPGAELGEWRDRIALPPNALFRFSSSETGVTGGQ